MSSLLSYLLLVIPLISVTISPKIYAATKIGVTYSTPPSIPGSVQISPETIAAKVISMKIPAIRLLDSNPAMIRAFENTNVSLFLSVPNHQVPLLASNRSFALCWIYRHVFSFHPLTKISMISVGNDAVSHSPDVSPSFLLRAMQNLHQSLQDLKLHEKISVSTTFSFSRIIAAQTPFSPPSSSQFQQPNGDSVIKPILRFLERTNSSFLINLYPYHIYRSSFSVPLGFALFEKSPFSFRDDLANGVRYTNLFDMMVDSLISSMDSMGHGDLPVIVAETGWPSSGIDASEVDAMLVYSEMFLKGLLSHLRDGCGGTPLRRRDGGVSEVYVYELVEKDDDINGGFRNWGILHHNMSNKYGFEFFDEGRYNIGDEEYVFGFSVLAVVLLCSGLWIIRQRKATQKLIELEREAALKAQ
ncbi:unnamed protein product [Cochlearia groenlandica]